ncbi:MAG: lysophospholipid acyltransferase family protein [Planctomycetota bacterium]|nr:MAG: lysophospholipid acyltransferase family protein [Planctomycetota bacterium]
MTEIGPPGQLGPESAPVVTAASEIHEARANPFTLDGVALPLRWLIGAVTRFPLMRQQYDQWLASGQQGTCAFVEHIFSVLRVEYHIEGLEHLDALPSQGPVVVVANHPLGALEGVLITKLLLQRRPDTRVLTNQLLLRIPEFRQVFIGVDILSSGQQTRNAQALRDASRHLEQGGLLMMFPAGTVSRMTWRDWRIKDAPWNQLAGRLAQRYGAPCLPIHVAGRNRRRFYLSGLISARLRTALLPRAMIGLGGRSFSLHLGSIMNLPSGLSPVASTDLLRLGVEVRAPEQRLTMPGAPGAQVEQPLIAPQPPAQLTEQLSKLEARCVHRRGDYAVYLAAYDELGCLASHLAREREATFRQAGEGTGQAADRDRYDDSHLHILVWDHAANALVGGYRVADARAVVERHGREGLYSASLYHLPADYLSDFDGGMEVGRSFVTPAYQTDLHALDLLWCGLGAFVQAHPHCHTFFGCVSISATYPPLMRSLITRCLLRHYGVPPEQQRAIRPVVAYHPAEPCWSPALEEELGEIAQLNRALAAIDPAWRIPVMIRHYLALGGRFYGFALNAGFNAAVDGLVAVDLRHSPDRYLRRYMGADGAVAFRERWAAVT